MGGAQSYYDIREKVWPGEECWGDDKREIANHLKKTWVDNNNTTVVATDDDTVVRERDQILQWWWARYKGDNSRVQMQNNHFMMHLKRAYDDFKFEEDNEDKGPRLRDNYEHTDTRNYAS